MNPSQMERHHYHTKMYFCNLSTKHNPTKKAVPQKIPWYFLRYSFFGWVVFR
eukprot:m.17763 g.17763  ORF g.17763 m.17763 type:complete len:52 (-) comp11663_c0_seq2:724-879(-)